MVLAKKIKIEVSEQDAQALEFMQAKCRGLYNWWVMRLRNGERWNLNRAKQSLQESKQYDPELRCVYGKLLADVYFRLEGAMRGFFRRVKNGEKPGFPRFKPRHQFFTLCYPGMYLEVQGKTIILPTGGGHSWGPKRYPNIGAHLTEDPPEHFREVAVSRDARGNYYCSFVYEDTEQSDQVGQNKPGKKQNSRPPHPRREEGIVAFDLGIKTLATGYTDQGRFYHIGDLSQRQMVIKKTEGETPKEKRKRHIRNRMVYNDWGLYGFVQMLVYKCLRFGKELHLLDERDTTKMCHVCQHKKAMPLWQRTYRCENCGLVMDRDDNSAVNIYQRFLAWLRPHTLGD